MEILSSMTVRLELLVVKAGSIVFKEKDRGDLYYILLNGKA